MTKILFSDMDGTVIERTEILHKKDVEMMHQLQNAGHLMVFNTGRNYQEALFCIEAHDFPYDYLVLNNGAHIVDNKGNDIFKKVIPGEIGKKIIEYALQVEGVWVFFYNGHKTLGCYDGKTYEHNGKGIVRIEGYDFFEEYKKVENFDIIAMNQEDVGVDKLMEIQNYIEQQYGQDAAGCINVHFLDVTAASCSKGTGIATLKQVVDKELETYSVGDAHNDISMFIESDHAYTFHRVEEDIYKHANKKVEYVYEVIEDMLK